MAMLEIFFGAGGRKPLQGVDSGRSEGSAWRRVPSLLAYGTPFDQL